MHDRGEGDLGALPAEEPPAAGWADLSLARIGSLLDAGVLRAMQIVVERALIPGPADVDTLRDSARDFLDPALESEPRRFFAFVDAPPPAPRPECRWRRNLRGGAVLDCRLESGYRPFARDPDVANGGPVHLELWQHTKGPPRGTVLALHGFTMGRPRIDAFALFAAQWFERGLDVALLTLPYHGARTPPDARFSGERFTVPHVGRLGEAVRESVYEIRLAAHWLREQSGAPVGVLGLSLGGYLAALAGGLCADLDFVIPMASPVCIGDLAWRFYARTRHARSGGEPALSARDLRRSFRVHSPLAHPLRVPRERVLIVAGRGDRIVPPEHPAALWRHWGEPSIHWFGGSHLAPFGRGGVVEAIERHLAGLGIL